MGSINQKQFIERTGMMYHAKSLTYYGTFGQYECFLQAPANQQYAVFTIGAAPQNGWDPSDPQTETAKALLNQNLGNLVVQYPELNACALVGSKVVATIKMGTSGKAMDAMLQVMTAITETLRQMQLVNCCTECGSVQDPHRMYSINGNNANCCDRCFTQINGALDQHQQEMQEKVENKGLGIVGAIGGTIAVFLLTFGLLKLGYIAYITGYLGLLCGLVLYKKLAGKLSIIGAAICIVLCLVGSCFANFYYVGGVIADYNEDFCADNPTMLETIASEREAVASLTDESINELSGGEYATADEYLAFVTNGEYSTIAQYSQFLDESEDEYKLCQEDQTAFKAMKEIPDCLDDNAEATGEIVKNLLWGIISIIVGAAVTVPVMLRESKGKYTIEPLA